MKKKLWIFILNNDNPKDIFENNKNKCIFYDETNQQFYFDSKFTAKTYLEINFVYLEINSDLEEGMYHLIIPAIDMAKEFSEEPIEYTDSNIQKIKGAITNTINAYSYYIDDSNNVDKLSIFAFAAEIFIKLVTFHPLINGNKRFSLSYLILLLKQIGYYFKWTSGTQKNYSKHEDKLCNFVKLLQDKEKINNTRNEIIQWIKNMSIISI